MTTRRQNTTCDVYEERIERGVKERIVEFKGRQKASPDSAFGEGRKKNMGSKKKENPMRVGGPRHNDNNRVGEGNGNCTSVAYEFKELGVG